MEAILRTNDKNAFNSIVRFLKSFHFEIETKDETSRLSKTKKIEANAKSIPLSDIDPDAKPELLFGIWEDRNITLEKLRNRAWGGRQ